MNFYEKFDKKKSFMLTAEDLEMILTYSFGKIKLNLDFIVLWQMMM